MRRHKPIAVLSVVVFALLASTFASAAAAAKPKSPPPPPSTPGAFVKTYSNTVGTKQFEVTPEDQQQTAEGGYVGLGITQAASETVPGVSWLVRLDSSGTPQSERAVGCQNSPPGDYADGTSVAATADGSEIVAGGTIGCGSGTNCPTSSGIQCGIVEKVSATGTVQFAKVYNAGASGSGFVKIRTTSDGGYIAVGSATNGEDKNGGLILKLGAQGEVQWQRQLGPLGTSEVLLNDVRQTSDGGYVVTGEEETPNATGQTFASVLVAKLSSGGSVEWQKTYNSFSNGAPSASNVAQAIVQTSDGGYAVAGHWVGAKTSRECCSGALVLKLSGTGALQFQKAYSGGLICFENGFNETCENLGAIANSIQQTPEGGYVLGGEANFREGGNIPLVPWIAQINSEGALTLQRDYFQSNSLTGRPISQPFASTSLTSDGGEFGLGSTTNQTTLEDELFAVKTNSSGLVGSSCSIVHTATGLTTMNPGFSETSQSLPVASNVSASGNSPATSVTTSVTTQSVC